MSHSTCLSNILLLYEHVRVRGVTFFFLLFSGSCSQETSMWYHMIRNVVYVVLWGILLRPTAGAVVLIPKCTTHPGGVLRDFIEVIHRDTYREHSLIGRHNCLMTEAANSLSAAAGPELSTTRSPIANLALDLATNTTGFAWVRVCVLWRPGVSVRRTQAER